MKGRETLLSAPAIDAAAPFTSAETTPGPTVPVTVIASFEVADPSSGVAMLIDGSPVIRLRVMVAGVPTGVPLPSVQTMVTTFGPSFGSSTVARNDPSATEAAMPLTLL